MSGQEGTGPFAARFAQAAEALVGVPFRLHGRDPAFGLDCIGVLVAAMAAAGRPVRWPNGYVLRQARVPEFGPMATPAGFAPAHGVLVRGDVVCVRPGPGQVHFAVACAPDRLVHAHAGLGRVVLGPLAGNWPRIGLWRAASEDEIARS